MQWAENLRTVEGHIVHEHAHDKLFTEKRKDVLVSRSVPVRSRELGLSGQCDVVEFHATPLGIRLFGRKGTWLPVPVEYKRGAPKENNVDRLQLCAQAICLEEMLVCPLIEKGYLYYAQTARRSEVLLDATLRAQVRKIVAEMHRLHQQKHTPLVKPSKSCSACSLKEVCLPKLGKNRSAAEYIRTRLQQEEGK